MALTRSARAWSLSPESFERLLACLAADRETAGERYERIRQKLTRLFEWRGCADHQELVDLAFDRVARRLEEGVDLHVSDPYVYFHGVAVRLLQEHWRRPERRTQPLDALGPAGPAAPPPVDATTGQRRLECLRECLDTLPPESRRLLEQYHRGEKGARIRARKELAATLRIPAAALRLRAYRVRARLHDCIDGCEGREGNGSPAGS